VTTWVDNISLTGATLRVGAADPLPAERETLALATAIRVFERFAALDTVVLAGGEGEIAVSRAEVERVLAPEGFGALRDRGRWPQVLARAIQRYGATDAERGT
jgi:hypothetical protein